MPTIVPIVVHTQSNTNSSPATAQDIREFCIFLAIAFIWACGLCKVFNFFERRLDSPGWGIVFYIMSTIAIIYGMTYL